MTGKELRMSDKVLLVLSMNGFAHCLKAGVLTLADLEAQTTLFAFSTMDVGTRRAFAALSEREGLPADIPFGRILAKAEEEGRVVYDDFTDQSRQLWWQQINTMLTKHGYNPVSLDTVSSTRHYDEVKAWIEGANPQINAVWSRPESD